MSTLELRNVITEHLSHIDDTSFLNALKNVLESKVSEGVFQLDAEQRERIDLARDQYKKGETISNINLQKEIDKWLNSK